MIWPAPGAHPKIGAVEILNRAGHVVQRIAWDGQPLRVGRAYDNDLVVSDPYVCPHHLELISADDGPAARDLGSVNGIYVGQRRERVDRTPLTDGFVLHFGHSQLRFHAAGSEVAPTLRDTARHGLLGRLGSPWVLVLAMALALAVLALNELLNTAEETSWFSIAGEMLYPLIGALLWAGFWALLNRVLSHRANFPVHLAIALLGISGLFVTAQLIAVTGFALGWSEAVWWLKLTGRITVLTCMIYAHLRYSLHGRGGRLVAVAAMASLMLFGTPATGEIIERSQFSTLPYLEPLLWPPSFRIAEGESVAGFIAGADELRARADRESSD